MSQDGKTAKAGPPREGSLDAPFPHPIARRRAGERQWVREQLGETDRNGRLARPVARLANWATARRNTPLRHLLESLARIDAEVELPRYHSRTATDRLKRPLAPNPEGPAF